jgi:hypothetical protein
MIIETIFSTLDEARKANFAPMGIVWDQESVIVRPFRSTQTCRNLISSHHGVANLSDNVLAYVQCGLFDTTLPSFPAITVPGVVFQGTCSWLELEVTGHGGSDERAEFQCRVLHKGRQRDFLGFCRAGNAVIEMAILATRLAFCDRKQVLNDLNHYMKIVEKTGGETEKQAMQLIYDYIQKREE